MPERMRHTESAPDMTPMSFLQPDGYGFVRSKRAFLVMRARSFPGGILSRKAAAAGPKDNPTSGTRLGFPLPQPRFKRRTTQYPVRVRVNFSQTCSGNNYIRSVLIRLQ